MSASVLMLRGGGQKCSFNLDTETGGSSADVPGFR